MLRLLKNNNNYLKLPDDALIQKFKETGEQKCIGVLFTRYTHLVFGICMKYLRSEADSEDTTMEIFEELFEKLQKHTVENFKNWLHSVARNKCLMILRKRKHIYGKKTVVYENYYAENVEKNDEIHLPNDNEDKNVKQRLEQALLQLKTEQQNCIRLMYIENMSYKQISNITGYGLKQVKSYIQNGKRKLRIFLEER